MFRCFTRKVTQSRFPNTTVLAPYLSIRIFDYILALQCTATHLYTKSSLRSSLSVRHRIIHIDKQSPGLSWWWDAYNSGLTPGP